MKTLIPLVVILTSSSPAMARDMNILCKTDVRRAACANRVTATMERLNCELRNRVDCKAYEHDKALEICTVAAAQCNEPHPGNFGGYTCYTGKKHRLDSGLSLPWWTGILQRYVREICAP